MSEWISKYIGGGILAVFGYVIISNTLWLLFGSKLLQSLPGVNIKGATGTLKMSILLIMTFTGFLVWLTKWPFIKLGIVNKQTLTDCISYWIQSASKIFSKRL
jgi:hypothetical protein